MVVKKFGGSSLANADKFRQVKDIICHEKDSSIIILSAVKGITNALIEASVKASVSDMDYLKNIKFVRETHEEIISSLFLGKDNNNIVNEINILLDKLEKILLGVELVKECSKRSLDLIMSYGERLSCIIMTYFLNSQNISSNYVDSRSFIKTDNKHGSANVLFKESYKLIREKLINEKRISVITGFIASNFENVTTTLGRNGSDFSASIIGAGLDSKKIEIWTDVDGVHSADPRIVDTSYVIDELSIEDAMELSYFGAEIIHPSTLLPSIDKNIPIVIKNTLNPSSKGTLIASSVSQCDRIITGVASINSVSIINIEGIGMIGIPGIAAKVFQSLADEEINIIMISQASSEHSICLVCREEEAILAVTALNKKLVDQISTKKIKPVQALHNHVIIAVIGENMRGKPGLTGKLFSALGEKNINILAIAQGSSERNISFVINAKYKIEALNTIHNSFLVNEENNEIL